MPCIAWHCIAACNLLSKLLVMMTTSMPPLPVCAGRRAGGSRAWQPRWLPRPRRVACPRLWPPASAARAPAPLQVRDRASGHCDSECIQPGSHSFQVKNVLCGCPADKFPPLSLFPCSSRRGSCGGASCAAQRCPQRPARQHSRGPHSAVSHLDCEHPAALHSVCGCLRPVAGGSIATDVCPPQRS